jgi:uncharacterized protein (DUF1810 family)
MTDDRFNLQRFVAAQHDEMERVLAELKDGCKRGHWMWFVFPQLRGLGRSDMANLYAISSRAEAEAYWEHPVLGPRLAECANLVNLVEGRSILEIFGSTDAMKFRSSMTLFAQSARNIGVFSDALDKYFAGLPDRPTLNLLGQIGN